jgi:NAD(P) transhydrogenase subunit alpha
LIFAPKAKWIPAFAGMTAQVKRRRHRGKEMIDGFLALYIFMLAAFTGKEIIGRVPVILHTPLMSGSNFVHGIVLVGAMIALASATSPLAIAIGFVGVVLGAGNAAGGYVVTERMLEMFKSSKSK